MKPSVSATKVDRAGWETVSAFANTRGGLILLGIDEQQGWRVTEGFKPEKIMQQLKAGLEASAKADPKVTPVPRCDLDYVDLDDAGAIIGLRIYPMRDDPFLICQMPCFVSAMGMTNGLFTRVVDEDHRLNAYQVSELRGLGGRENLP
ncbi:AlbA family DNA-binding domain-containing protein [Corynebacterium freneyi]